MIEEQFAIQDLKVKNGICPDCGSTDWQLPPAANPTMMVRCMDCGAAFLIEVGQKRGGGDDLHRG